MLPLAAFDLETLAMALENQFLDLDTFFWVDPATGRIEFWSEGVSDEAESEGWDVDDRGGLRIDAMDSHEGYRDMETFVFGVKDPHRRDRLARSIDHGKPFRHFKDALHQYPEELAQWYVFHDAAMQVRAIEWLQDNGLIALAEADTELARLREPSRESSRGPSPRSGPPLT